MKYNIENLYNENYGKIRQHIRFKISDDVIVDELTNDVFVKAYGALDRFDDTQAKVTTWLYCIANNTIIDHYRKENRNKTTSMSDIVRDDTKEYDITFDSLTPELIMNNNEIAIAINKAIAKLRPNLKETFLLRFNEDLSYIEISEKMNIPMGTVKGNINRAKELLAIELKKIKESI